MTRPALALIAAVAANRTIGLAGDMPWQMPADLAYFKRITSGHPVIMGRRTRESLGRALPGRRNIVVSSNPHAQFPGAEAVTSFEAALDLCADVDLVFCIGGAVLYEHALPRADFLYLTEIKQDIEGDTFFPEFDRSAWQELSRAPETQEAEPRQYDFVVYSKRPA